MAELLYDHTGFGPPIRTWVLKTDPAVFDATWNGLKSYEIRDGSDADFKPDDWLCLKRTTYSGAEMRQGAPLIYTGHEIKTQIRHVLGGGYGLKPNWVILSHSTVETNNVLHCQQTKL